MKKYGVNELRRMFLEFFEGKGHLAMKSFSLVPHNDDSLLIINSGMAPLKPYFTGQEVPPRKRVTTCQKCIRTGDLENVGKTARHGTFFEMLGNFSFGDYFKKESIPWAWEFLTETVGLDPDRLYPSIYVDDDEAFKVWNEDMGIPAERIFRFGKEDNFWEHGSGPCGPCSEIYYDRGEKYGCGKPDCTVGCDCDRYMEVWNIVFSQFDNDGKGHYSELKQKNIDTGMGLERLAVAVQDVDSIFDVDTVRSLRDAVCALSGSEYGVKHETDVSIRIITDHVRSATFMISDGILPSNEGRGYVLRRLIRRAARHGRLLGIEGAFLSKLSENVIEGSKDGYPELDEKRDFILNVVTQEENKFEKTIDSGLSVLKDMTAELSKNGEKVLSGSEAFKLYDTFGFPLDLTREILEEKGFSVDEGGYRAAMQEQSDRARKARKKSNYMGADATVYEEIDAALQSAFVGYEHTEYDGKVIALCSLAAEGEGNDEVVDALTDGMSGAIITDFTPFYGTMGGQVGDKGTIIGPDGEFQVEITEHVAGSKIAHIGKVIRGMFRRGESVSLKVDMENRASVCRNHSATHLLQSALKDVLGSHVEQSGSYQDAGKTRFDFSHFEAMSTSQIEEVEKEVNREIAKSIPVVTEVLSLEDAKKTGATALFGEKYGDTVRVVEMGDFSKEFCGGTHVKNTGDIQSFKIISESGVAAGVRRIEAITGQNVVSYYKEIENELEKAAALLKASKYDVSDKIQKLQDEIKELRSENESLKSKSAADSLGNIEDKIKEVKGLKFIASEVQNADRAALRDLSDKLREKIQEGVVVLISKADGRVSIVVSATEGAIKRGAHAGNLIKIIAPLVGGGGGGRPNMAEAGGKNPAGVPAALEKVGQALEDMI